MFVAFRTVIDAEQDSGFISKHLIGREDNAGKGDMYRTLVDELARWNQVLAPSGEERPTCSLEVTPRGDVDGTLSVAEINSRAEATSRCLSVRLMAVDDLNRAIGSYNDRVSVIRSYNGTVSRFRQLALLVPPHVGPEDLRLLSFNPAGVVYKDLIEGRLLQGEPLALLMAFLAIFLDLGTIAAVTSSATQNQELSSRL